MHLGLLWDPVDTLFEQEVEKCLSGKRELRCVTFDREHRSTRYSSERKRNYRLIRTIVVRFDNEHMNTRANGEARGRPEL